MRYVGCGFDDSAGFITFGGQFQNLKGSKNINKGKESSELADEASEGAWVT